MKKQLEQKNVWTGQHPSNSRIIGLESLARDGSTEQVKRKAIAALKKYHQIDFKG